MKKESYFKKLPIFITIAILTALSIFILWPLASSIILGLILAYALYPVYKKIFSLVKERNVAAILVILFIVFLILIPVWFLFPFIVKQIFDIYLYLQNIDFLRFLKNVFPSLASTDFSKDFVLSINSFISSMTSKILSSASSMLLNLPTLILKAAVVFFVLFFGMRDAETIKKYAISLSPFSKLTEKRFIEKFKDITSSVIYGHILIGIIQGLLTGIGLFIFRIPQALLLTLIAMLASMMPIIGAWIVWLPASIYLLVSGKIFSGIFLLLYGAIFVSWIDNIIKPYIIARKAKISSAIVLIGMIGGLIVFGFLGLIIGPLILSYLLLILDAYRNKNFPKLFSK